MAVPIMVLVAFISVLFITSQMRSGLAQVNNSERYSDTIKVTGNILTESKDEEENWFSNPLKFLSHPFILVLVGSTASGLIIAIFTRKWERKQKDLDFNRQQAQQTLELARQERQKNLELDIGRHQKELELKTNLVDQISRSVASIVLSILLEKTRPLSSSKHQSKDLVTDEIFKIYREWEISSRSISSQLSAYFIKIEIAQDWDHLHELINDFYALVISKVGTKEKDQYKMKLHDQFVTKNNIDWENITSTESPKEITALWQAGDSILEHSRQFIDRIIREEISRLDVTDSISEKYKGNRDN